MKVAATCCAPHFADARFVTVTGWGLATRFPQLVAALDTEMGDAPKLRSQRSVIEHVLRQEEERFAETLDQGMRMLDQAIAGMSGEVIDGETVFRLYDTYGFPVDLTADIARERGLSADVEGFEVQMEAQRNRARASEQFHHGGS